MDTDEGGSRRGFNAEAQRGKAATEPREALGVRGACSRFRAAPALRQRQQAGRTPYASRGSLSTKLTFHVSRTTHRASRLPPCPSRIKRLTNEQVQIVDGQRELSIGLGG